jgi:hypothetical protein
MKKQGEIMYTNLYAGGGRLKRGKMVIAHFNPHELNGLDYLQGKKETCPRSGMRSYSHLEELLKNPHILRGVMHHVEGKVNPKRHGHAGGGQPHDYRNPQLNRMADEGVHGDSELALIGPHTKNVLDHLTAMEGYPITHNPHTGHPHYGILDGLLGGLSSVISKIPLIGPTLGKVASGIGNFLGTHASTIIPAATAVAQQALPALADKLGAGDTGRNLAQIANNAINSVTQQYYTPDQIAQGQQLANRASQFGQGLYNSYQQGGMQQMGRDLGGQALNQMSQYAGQYGGGIPGQLMSQMGQGLQAGQSLADIARGAGRGALQQMAAYGQ